MTLTITRPAGGDTLRAGPMAIRVLEDGSHTGHRLGIVEITIPPGTGGPPQHVHRQHDETFYVLSGTPVFTTGGNTIEAKTGTLITAPPGTPHTFANPGGEPAVLIATITPDLYIGYFRELSNQPPGQLDPRSSRPDHGPLRYRPHPPAPLTRQAPGAVPSSPAPPVTRCAPTAVTSYSSPRTTTARSPS